MSIHVVSAVLKCRDPELSSSRRMVMVVLANYAGDSGRAWPSQQLIANEAGCGIRSIKDHLAWLEKAGFITRTTTNLGQGNGSRTSYQIHADRLAQTLSDAGEEIAGANFARANEREARCSIPHLTNRQEPSIPIDTNVSIGQPTEKPPEPKRSGKVRGASRKTGLPENWAPSIKAYSVASQAGLSREEINHEADQFRNSAIANGRTYADWDAAFRTWIGNSVKWRAERTAKRASVQRGGAEQTLSAFDRVAESLGGNGIRPAAPAQSDAFTIDGDYIVPGPRTGTC